MPESLTLFNGPGPYRESPPASQLTCSILVGILFAPESPWWLVRHGREAEARKALLSLTSKRHTSYNVDDAVALIQHTNEYERHVSSGTRYLDCFKGVDRRRTEICCMTWIGQVTCGIWFGGNITYFLEQAGFNPAHSFAFGTGENALGFCGTVLSWFIMTKVGRRRLFVTGMGLLFTILCVIGFLGIPEVTPAIGYTQAAFLMLYVLTYDLSVGPSVYAIVSEMPSTRLRIKTVVIARNCYNIASICANELNAPILNPTAWGLRGKGGFVSQPLGSCSRPRFGVVSPFSPLYGPFSGFPKPKVARRKSSMSCSMMVFPPASSGQHRWWCTLRMSPRLL